MNPKIIVQENNEHIKLTGRKNFNFGNIRNNLMDDTERHSHGTIGIEKSRWAYPLRTK